MYVYLLRLSPVNNSELAQVAKHCREVRDDTRIPGKLIEMRPTFAGKIRPSESTARTGCELLLDAVNRREPRA